MVLDFIIFGLIYVLLLFILLLYKRNLGRRNNNDSDDEGGISNISPPKLDLPPGVSWPVDPAVPTKDREDVPA